MSNHLLIVGAGPGVALGVAKRFAREHFRISLVARRAESLQNLQQELADDGTDVSTYTADVANFGQLRQTLSTVLAERGPATVLLYNPSVYREADALTLDPEVFLQDMRTDVAGLLVAVQAVAPAMQQVGSGTVLVTGGSTALQPYGPLTSLSVGKAAVRNMAECVRQTLEPAGIRVGTVTIMGAVGSNDHFAPDRIAEAFWAMYQQPQDQWQFETVYE